MLARLCPRLQKLILEVFHEKKFLYCFALGKRVTIKKRHPQKQWDSNLKENPNIYDILINVVEHNIWHHKLYLELTLACM